MYNLPHELVDNQIAEGITIKVLNQEGSVVMTEFQIRKGTLLPEHVHRSDHSAYLVQGNIRMVIDNVSRDLVKGDGWYIGKNVPHHTEALEDSTLLEVYRLESEELIDAELTLAPEMQG